MQVQSFPVQGIQLHDDVHIRGTAEQVFASLTTGIARWWSPARLENSRLASDLIIEPKIGGRVYETWKGSSDRSGALLAHVIQIRENHLLKLAGHFTFEEQALNGIAEFAIAKDGHDSVVHFTFEATGRIDNQLTEKIKSFWHDSLSSLKLHVEEHKAIGVKGDLSTRRRKDS